MKKILFSDTIINWPFSFLPGISKYQIRESINETQASIFVLQFSLHNTDNVGLQDSVSLGQFEDTHTVHARQAHRALLSHTVFSASRRRTSV